MSDPSEKEPQADKKPERKWLLVAVAVPLIVAVIGIVPKLFEGDAPPPQLRTPTTYNVKRGGVNVQGNAEFTNISNITQQILAAKLELPPGLVEKLEAISAKLSAGQFEQALPLLEEIRKVAPVAGVLNNLGVTHKALGHTRVGQQLLAEALSKAPEPSPETLHNFRVGAGITVKSKIRDVFIELVRFKDTGGMYTLDVRFWNLGKSKSPSKDWLIDCYILDEVKNKKWGLAHYGEYQKAILAGDSLETWAKFKIDEGLPEPFTLVLGMAASPIEQLTLNRIAEGN
ncbi:MAG: hypothetical protein V3T86_04975 [Planctomycetota bacterium]